MEKARVTTRTLLKMKQEKKKICVVTAYDYPTGLALEEAGAEVVLVGDSLGMVVLGYESTLAVSLDEMIHHAKAVCRAVKKALVVVDMPFMSYQESPVQALRSAGRLLKETGAQAVKLEGGLEVAETVSTLRRACLAGVGHVGLKPPAVHGLGGVRALGPTPRRPAALRPGAQGLGQR